MPPTKRKQSWHPTSERMHFFVCLYSTAYFAFIIIYLFSMSFEHIKKHNLEWSSVVREPVDDFVDVSIQIHWMFSDLLMLVLNTHFANKAKLAKNTFIYRHHIILMGASLIKSIGFGCFAIAVQRHHPDHKKFQGMSMAAATWFFAIVMIMSCYEVLMTDDE